MDHNNYKYKYYKYALKLTNLKKMLGGHNFNELKNYLDMRDTFAVMIMQGKQNPQVIFEYGNISEPTNVASVRKTVLGILYGMYDIDLTKTLDELQITDVGDLLPKEKQATIGDLLAARSGVYHPASNPGDNPNKPERGDKDPGTFYLYNNWDFNVAGTIFEQVTGISIFDALNDLGKKIGFEDYDIDKHKQVAERRKTINRSVSIHPPYQMFLSARDMGKIGLLMLNNGKWNGEQLVPSDWIKKMTTIISSKLEVNPRYAYGYMCKLFDEEQEHFLSGAYFASGKGEQNIMVIPKLNMVIVIKGASTDVLRKQMVKIKYMEVIDLVKESLSR